MSLQSALEYVYILTIKITIIPIFCFNLSLLMLCMLNFTAKITKVKNMQKSLVLGQKCEFLDEKTQ